MLGHLKGTEFGHYSTLWACHLYFCVTSSMHLSAVSPMDWSSQWGIYLFNIYEVNGALIFISQTRRQSARSVHVQVLYFVLRPLSRVLARLGNLKADSLHLPQVVPVSTPFCTWGGFRIGQWHYIITISCIIWPIFGYGNWRPAFLWDSALLFP